MSLATSESVRAGRPRVLMTVEEAAIEPLVDELVTRVTHNGLTLPDVLHIPESTEAILSYTDFKEQVIARVSGLAVKHS